MLSTLGSGLLLALGGCGEASAGTDAGSRGDLSPLGAAPLAASSQPGCDELAAGQGWLNRPVSGVSGAFTASWRSTPAHHDGAGPIDAVLGFALGAADGFSDLGPMVRFAPSGYIDARNGGVYGGAFPYTYGDGPYEFQLFIDVTQHRYSAFIRHLDSPFKPFEVLAHDFAFRNEQGGVAALDHFASVVDSPSGALQTCGYAQEPPSGCAHSGPGAWRSRPFATLNPDQAQLDFYAWVTAPDTDAVIGASLGAPARFTDLAAIVRFRPDGRFDARDGSGYAADQELAYTAGAYYRVTLGLDLGLGSYSVWITPPGQNTVALARDYAFRSEQAGAAALDHLAQYVDSAARSVHTCALVAR